MTMTMTTASASIISDMFRPPVNRAMKVLDRSFFKKTIPTSVARVLDRKQISKCRSDLHHQLLKLDRMQTVRSVHDTQGVETKVLLLKPDVNSAGKTIDVPMHLGQK